MSTETRHDPLFDRIRRSLARDHDLPLSHKIEKALRFGLSAGLAPLYLLGCDEVGPGARTRGRPVISSSGRIEIGARALIGSMFSPSVLSAGPEGKIEIGDDLIMNYGASISARRLVKLGHHVRLGPYVTIADDDGEAGDESGPAPIFIGDDVWLATRARVRKGAVIGGGSVIAAGSVVSGVIPPGVLAGGVPARVLRQLKPAPEGQGKGPFVVAVSPPDTSAQPEFQNAPSASGGGPRSALRRAHALASEGLARLALRGVDHVGERPRVHRAPFIENLGTITIGDDLELCPGPVQAHLVTGVGGVLRIGDGVTIGAGCGIAAESLIEISDGAHLEPFVSLLGTDYHVAGEFEAAGTAAPIEIGAHAWIGERVTVLRGVKIGRYARVEPGSVVTCDIPDGALAGGVRARVIGRAEQAVSRPPAGEERPS